MKNIALCIVLITSVFGLQANYCYPEYIEYESPIFIENHFFYVENICPFCEQQELVQPPVQPTQKPKTNNFMRFIRPSLKTIKAMTSTLSWILGTAAIIAGFDWFDRRESLTNDEKKNKLIIITAWLANKTMYHLSDYVLEEIGA